MNMAKTFLHKQVLMRNFVACKLCTIQIGH